MWHARTLSQGENDPCETLCARFAVASMKGTCGRQNFHSARNDSHFLLAMTIA
jgi:hypothetical protein